jgi:hypothetical protein
VTTCVVVASGPSLTVDQCAQVAAAQAAGKCHTLVVNDNWRLLPDADVLYAADGRWWRLHWPAVNAGFRGEMWTCKRDTAKQYGICYIDSTPRKPGVSRTPGLIHEGGNSGYQAIGLAYHFGATRIVLIGFDMQHRPGDPPHWFGKHPQGLSNAGGVKDWAPKFNALADDLRAEGVELLNCSLRTALTVPRTDLTEALEAH